MQKPNYSKSFSHGFKTELVGTKNRVLFIYSELELVVYDPEQHQTLSNNTLYLITNTNVYDVINNYI